MDDKSGLASRRKREKPGIPSIEMDDEERFTVFELEEKVRSGNSGNNFSTSRSRKQRRKEESGSGFLLSLFITVMVIAYLGFLSFGLVKKRVSAPQEGVKPGSETVSPATSSSKAPDMAVVNSPYPKSPR